MGEYEAVFAGAGAFADLAQTLIVWRARGGEIERPAGAGGERLQFIVAHQEDGLLAGLKRPKPGGGEEFGRAHAHCD